MNTAPGSEPLSKRHREPVGRLAERAGPCDPQDPQPRIPDDTPPDERPPAPGIDPGAAPGIPRGPRDDAAIAIPGAHETTVDPDAAYGMSEHDTSARLAASPPGTAEPRPPGAADAGRAGPRPVAEKTAPRG